MKKTLYKSGLFTCLFIIFFSLISPVAIAQANLFDPLDDIKEKVEGSQDRVEGDEKETVNIKLVDFSKKEWGSLNKDLIDKLKGEGYENLNDIAKKAGYSQSKGNVQDLIYYLEDQKFLETNSGDLITLSNDEVNLIVGEIRFRGESQLYSIILAIAKVMRNIIGGIAILWIVISGIQMIFAQGDENKLTEQKNSITYALIGLAVILLMERGVTLLYGTPGVERGIDTTKLGEGISPEIFGVISFIKALIGSVAILMIIISGFKTIASVGEEEKITTQKKAVLWIVVGIIVILINQVIVENLYIKPVEAENVIAQSNVADIINVFGTVLQFLLGFVGIVAFVALIYAGASMIANYGNDEQVQKAKKIIINAIIGIIIILSAYAIVTTVIKFS